tara:strand:- start:2 stop:292 length:291 start_codon:yes stop_codon:yes gene_type:complete
MTDTIESQSDIRCDVCDVSTRVPGYGSQFGRLEALWGYGSRHDGERYRVHLCEMCFFNALAHLRQERRISRLFDEVQPADDPSFGRLATDDYFGES